MRFKTRFEAAEILHALPLLGERHERQEKMIEKTSVRRNHLSKQKTVAYKFLNNLTEFILFTIERTKNEFVRKQPS